MTFWVCLGLLWNSWKFQLIELGIKLWLYLELQRGVLAGNGEFLLSNNSFDGILGMESY